jgi:hypothetical protein
LHLLIGHIVTLRRLTSLAKASQAEASLVFCSREIKSLVAGLARKNNSRGSNASLLQDRCER